MPKIPSCPSSSCSGKSPKQRVGSKGMFLEDGEQLCAFSDDVLLATPCSPAVQARVSGKTKVWKRIAPEDIEELREEAWQPESLKVLCCQAPTPGPTTRARFFQACLAGTHKTTTTAFGQRWRPFFNISGEVENEKPMGTDFDQFRLQPIFGC